MQAAPAQDAGLGSVLLGAVVIGDGQFVVLLGGDLLIAGGQPADEAAVGDGVFDDFPGPAGGGAEEVSNDQLLRLVEQAQWAGGVPCVGLP